MQDFFDAYPGEQKPESWLYWRAYLQFYASIFYFEAKDHKQAEKEIDYGVDCLEDIEEKSEEAVNMNFDKNLSLPDYEKPPTQKTEEKEEGERR